MERNISDMLDDIQIDDIEMKNLTPLSARRIRKMTMAHVEKRKPVGIKWLTRVAAIAAVVMALTVSVFAADVVLNDGELFGVFFGDELSDDEIDLMVDIGRTFGESVTSNGTTITPIQAVADETTLWLHLRVEAPEGVVLPDISEEDGYFYSFGSKDYGLQVMVEYFDIRYNEWEKTYVSNSVKPLADEDPTDNVKEFVLHLSKEGTSTIFNGPWKKRLNIGGLYLYQGITNYKEVLFTGAFTFDISIYNENREEQTIVIDTDGVSFYNEEYDFTTTVNSVTITPLNITIDYTCTDANNKYIFPRGGPIEIVMTDGTVIEAVDAYFDANSQKQFHPDSIVGIGATRSLDEPIVLENIDYIIIGGEYIFDVN